MGRKVANLKCTPKDDSAPYDLSYRSALRILLIPQTQSVCDGRVTEDGAELTSPALYGQRIFRSSAVFFAKTGDGEMRGRQSTSTQHPNAAEWTHTSTDTRTLAQ